MRSSIGNIRGIILFEEYQIDHTTMTSPGSLLAVSCLALSLLFIFIQGSHAGGFYPDTFDEYRGRFGIV